MIPRVAATDTTQVPVFALDQVPLEHIAAAEGTPCYVYSAAVVQARLLALRQAFDGCEWPYALHYALKANSSLGIARLIRDGGAEADANSIGEIDLAIRAGFRPDQIVFTGVGKSPDELARAVALDLKAINAESAGELDRIEALGQSHGRRVRVALRVNPDVDAQTHAHITTGLKSSKFGVPLADAADMVRSRRDARGLEFVGLHVHVGSQITSLGPLCAAARRVADLAVALRAEGLPLSHLDLGGGLGIVYESGADVPTYDAFARALVDVARPTGLGLIVEPGRTLVGPAGVLLARVIDVKPHAGGGRFVVLDAGMSELLRPALYGAYHRIVPVTDSGRPVVSCSVVGPVCESSDTFGRDRDLPEPAVGDLMAIMDAGAYGAVMSNTYNRRPLPPEVLVQADGTWRVIRRRQTIDDMLALEQA
jgi:diaminopimelate decarboxylase